MGFKDKMTKYYSDAYMNKYGDRMTSVSGTVLSVKTETKSFLGIFNRLHVWLVVNLMLVSKYVNVNIREIDGLKSLNL